MIQYLFAFIILASGFIGTAKFLLWHQKKAEKEANKALSSLKSAIIRKQIIKKQIKENTKTHVFNPKVGEITLNIGDRIRVNYRNGQVLEGKMVAWDFLIITVKDDNGKQIKLCPFGMDIKSIETLEA